MPGNPSYSMANMGSNGNAATDNPTPLRNLSPTAPGATLGTASGGASLSTTASVGQPTTAGASPTATAGVGGQPITWWASLIVLFIVLGLVAKKAGNESEFGNLKVSAYNILMITLASVIGIAGLKVLFTRFPVPGISTLIQAV